MTFADGSSYSGQWINGLRHKTGTMRYPNGSTYEGEFFEDIPEGSGKLYDAEERSAYEGQFAAGMREGEGTCIYESGDRFVGQWHRNMEVTGIKHCSNGIIERVEYIDDIMVCREEVSPEEASGEPKEAPAEAKTEEPKEEVAENATVADVEQQDPEPQ